MHEAHVGEAAELYALGLLSADEAAELNAHLASCAECVRAVGSAEETLLALERQSRAISVSAARASRNWARYAIAAALVIGLLPSIPLFVGLRHANEVALGRNAAAVAMIHSHFNHAEFTSVDTRTVMPAAKVVYARDHSWAYVIVDSSHAYRVEAVRNNSLVFLGTTVPSGTVSELWLSTSLRTDSLELFDGTVLLERARLR